MARMEESQDIRREVEAIDPVGSGALTEPLSLHMELFDCPEMHHQDVSVHISVKSPEEMTLVTKCTNLICRVPTVIRHFFIV